MDDFFLVLFFVSLGVLIFSLIKPQRIGTLFSKEKPFKRGQLAGVFGGLMVFFLILFGVFSQENSAHANQTQVVKQELKKGIIALVPKKIGKIIDPVVEKIEKNPIIREELRDNKIDDLPVQIAELTDNKIYELPVQIAELQGEFQNVLGEFRNVSTQLKSVITQIDSKVDGVIGMFSLIYWLFGGVFLALVGNFILIWFKL